MIKKLGEKNGRFSFCSYLKNGYENFPAPFDQIYCSTQITLSHPVSLSTEAPPCEKIMDYTHTLKIEQTKTIDSVEMTNGEPTKGKKIVITGSIQLKLEYISCQDPSQKIYFSEWELPFNSIMLQATCHNPQLFPNAFDLRNYMVYICLEYLKISPKTERRFDTTVALLIWLQELNAAHCTKDGGL